MLLRHSHSPNSSHDHRCGCLIVASLLILTLGRVTIATAADAPTTIMQADPADATAPSAEDDPGPGSASATAQSLADALNLLGGVDIAQASNGTVLFGAAPINNSGLSYAVRNSMAGLLDMSNTLSGGAGNADAAGNDTTVSTRSSGSSGSVAGGNDGPSVASQRGTEQAAVPAPTPAAASSSSSSPASAVASSNKDKDPGSNKSPVTKDVQLRISATEPCHGLDQVQIPSRTSLQAYSVCCGEVEYPRLCEYCPSFIRVCDYGGFRANSSYDTQDGSCAYWPNPDPTAKLSDEAFAEAQPIATPYAKQFCQAAGRVQEQQFKASQLPPPPPVSLRAGNLERTGDGCPVATPDCLKTGAYELILNPKGKASTGVQLQHLALLPGGSRIIGVSRQQNWNLVPYEPNTYHAVSVVFDAVKGTYEPRPVYPNPFCIGLVHLSDGTVLAAGGEADGNSYPEAPTPWLVEGRKTIRLYRPQDDAWTISPLEMSTNRWYPTQTSLYDGRILIAAGYTALGGDPNHSVDVYDPRPDPPTLTHLETIPFTDSLGYDTLYPSIFYFAVPDLAPRKGLDPTVQLLSMFSCREGQVAAIDGNNVVTQIAKFPDLPIRGCAAYTAMGTALLLPMHPENNYDTEYMMFGGSGQSYTACRCDTPAISQSFRLPISQMVRDPKKKVQWEMEEMPIARTGGDAVLLPNGKILIVNGAQFGVQAGGVGGGNEARGSSLLAVLYDPQAPAGKRYTTMASTTISRMYHSNAALLPSGDVLIAGSEQGECTEMCVSKAPYRPEFRAETFRLPYSYSSDRPSIEDADKALIVPVGSQITVKYTGKVTAATIATPAARTHSLDANQRLVFLQVTANKGGQITLQLPSDASRVAVPGWYMLFLLNGDIPCTMAVWIQMQRPAGQLPAVPAAQPPVVPSQPTKGGGKKEGGKKHGDEPPDVQPQPVKGEQAAPKPAPPPAPVAEPAKQGGGGGGGGGGKKKPPAAPALAPANDNVNGNKKNGDKPSDAQPQPAKEEQAAPPAAVAEPAKHGGGGGGGGGKKKPSAAPANDSEGGNEDEQQIDEEQQDVDTGSRRHGGFFRPLSRLLG